MNGILGHLCAHNNRLNWTRKPSEVGEMNEMTIQTQDAKFEPWRSEAKHAISRSQRLPTILHLYE